MTDSILNSVKKVLGIEPDYSAFDVDITMHINTVFATLHQLGVGPEDGFEISDGESKWEDFVGTTKNLSSVKSYVCLKVRLIFDPPATSFAIASMEKVVTELEWRLNVVTEGIKYPYVQEVSVANE